MYTVGPSEGERFYLRLLLLHVKGACSFEDLRTHNNIIHSTFKDAAQSRGLLPDDSEWDKCLQEASSIKMPNSLRNLFASICIFSNPTDPLTLFTKYLDFFIEDYLFHNNNREIAINKCLHHFEKYFQVNDKKCSHFYLPQPTKVIEDDEPLNTNYEKILADGLYRQLNQNQLHVVETILQAVHNFAPQNSNAFFIDGPGGTGKTHCYNTLTRILRSESKHVVTVAWTGIAATLLIDGRTVHKKLSTAFKSNRIVYIVNVLKFEKS